MISSTSRRIFFLAYCYCRNVGGEDSDCLFAAFVAFLRVAQLACSYYHRIRFSAFLASWNIERFSSLDANAWILCWSWSYDPRAHIGNHGKIFAPVVSLVWFLILTLDSRNHSASAKIAQRFPFRITICRRVDLPNHSQFCCHDLAKTFWVRS